MPSPVCAICRQPFRTGELTFTGGTQEGNVHLTAEQCCSAIVRHVLEIATATSEKHWSDFKRGEHRGDPYYDGKSDGAEEVAEAVRAAFPEVKCDC